MKHIDNERKSLFIHCQPLSYCFQEKTNHIRHMFFQVLFRLQNTGSVTSISFYFFIKNEHFYTKSIKETLQETDDRFPETSFINSSYQKIYGCQNSFCDILEFNRTIMIAFPMRFQLPVICLPGKPQPLSNFHGGMGLSIFHDLFVEDTRISSSSFFWSSGQLTHLGQYLGTYTHRQ